MLYLSFVQQVAEALEASEGESHVCIYTTNNLIHQEILHLKKIQLSFSKKLDPGCRTQSPRQPDSQAMEILKFPNFEKLLAEPCGRNAAAASRRT